MEAIKYSRAVLDMSFFLAKRRKTDFHLSHANKKNENGVPFYLNTSMLYWSPKVKHVILLTNFVR